MSSQDFDRLLDLLPSLSPDQLDRLRDRVEVVAVRGASGGPDAADLDLQRRLLRLGLVGEIKPPIRVPDSGLDREPVPIRGEALAETMVRERR